MNICYTICSANDLFRAKTFITSLSKFEPDIKIFIGLADKIDDRFNPGDFQPASILEVHSLAIPEFKAMSSIYSITELNCSLKPFFAEYIFKKYSPDKLLYFDTDILITAPITSILNDLDENNLLLTPHTTSPLPADNKFPLERHFLGAGIYNGGFIGMKNCAETERFIQWWSTRLTTQCFINPADFMYFDQNWLSIVPIFFNGVKILINPGYNVAYWNLHERRLGIDDAGKYIINQSHPLVFFHFSGYDPAKPVIISKHQDRYSVKDSDSLDKLFNDYNGQLLQNGFEKYSVMACAYGKRKKKRSLVKKLFSELAGSLGFEIIKKR